MKSSAQVKLIGDSYAGFYSCGLTMLNSDTMKRFSVNEKLSSDTQTVYETMDGLVMKVTHTENEMTGATEIQTSITNNGKASVKLEMITSFLLPKVQADKIHRFKSFWSAEGRHQIDSIYELNLEQSWNKMAYRVEKFGNVGSMPVRSYFPFVALEDSKTGDFTAVQLYSPSSWQIEIVKQFEEGLIVTGGIADRDSGDWKKILKVGETLVCPKAVAATGKSLEEVCDKLVKTQNPDISPVDNKMGITFNEYCVTWGCPTIDKIKNIVDQLSEKAKDKIQYLVIDSGWYGKSDGYWWDYTGEWTINTERFPNGLKEAADYIRSKGMIPGIWFEFEVVSPKSKLWNDKEHVLLKDGVPLSIGGRQFLDMENPWVIEFLTNNVIKTLKDNGFGYIKIDYNDTIGLGCDGEPDEGLGETLRKKVLATQKFFRKLREEMPELVIENCSSGGHRLEASFMQLASMASFSDAHEIKALPIIAANVLRFIKPEQNQIWAVLRKDDSDARIFYSLCSTMLGRMGLSGDIYDLSEHQWKLFNDGMDFYIKASAVIKNGKTIINCCNVLSYNEPEGNQLVVRIDEKTGVGLAVYHTFGKSVNVESFLENQSVLSDVETNCKNLLDNSSLIAEYGSASEDFSAKAWLFRL